MKYNTELIQAYLEDKQIEDCSCFSLLKQFESPDKKRKDVVQELAEQLEDILEEFPVFNKGLWKALFHNSQKVLNQLSVVPVVGTHRNQIISKDDRIYILMDLIHIADYTHIVSQMTYIMQNYLTLEISRLCIHEDFPILHRNYLSLLDYFTFCNGLSNFLAWNEKAEDYKFHMEKYEPYKEKAFGMLAGALDVTNKALQHKILINATNGDLWNQFPSSAGMFYFHDLYSEYGKAGITAIYKKGPERFIQHIFQN